MASPDDATTMNAVDLGLATPPALRRQLSYNCSREPMNHERKLSHSYSSSAVSSPASSTTSSRKSYYHAAMSNKSSSCDSIPAVDVIPAPELEKQPSSASSYESFIQLEADDLNRISETQPPAVQTMSGGGGGGYDPGRLPSSMFRTHSMSPANNGGGDAGWSFNSSESLFSIPLSHSGDISGDLYYDAGAGGSGSFRRVASARHDPPPPAAGGGLCVSESCARCSSAGGKTRKSVRFASADEIVSVSISGESGSGINQSPIFPTLADALGEARALAAVERRKTTSSAAAATQGWCCLPTPPSVWWARCACRGGGCCGVFGCGDYCRC
uniref:Uncharacterized protein n=1 Tax=Leersia perrieri TaxID=77586 RepID=A0A0D9WDN7_9ORYZ